MAGSNFPIPRPKDPLNAEFWDHCRNRRLCFQQCAGCGRHRHVPRYMCPFCGSPDWAWQESAGRGRIFSWTVTWRAMHPAFADQLPYATVVVEMDEGVRMVSRVRDMELDALTLDLPVELVWEEVTNDFTLPYFRPQAAA
jgi:uncharacterized OB-fold protein